MVQLKDFSPEQLALFEAEVQKKYSEYVEKGYSINMARGKPAAKQLDLSDNLLYMSKDEENYNFRNIFRKACINY